MWSESIFPMEETATHMINSEQISRFSPASQSLDSDVDPNDIIARCLHHITRAYSGTGLQTFLVADIEKIIASFPTTPSRGPNPIIPPELSQTFDWSSFFSRVLRATFDQISEFFFRTISFLMQPALLGILQRRRL
jgi:hypothetical protein